jgi:hypothetical protein
MVCALLRTPDDTSTLAHTGRHCLLPGRYILPDTLIADIFVGLVGTFLCRRLLSGIAGSYTWICLSRRLEVTLPARRALGCGEEACPRDLAPAPPADTTNWDAPALGFALLKASCCLVASDKSWLSRACCSRSASLDKQDKSLATSATALRFFTGEL